MLEPNALQLACWAGHASIAEELVKLGANVLALSPPTRIMICITADHFLTRVRMADILCVQRLMVRSQVCGTNKRGYTALHFAALQGHLEVCKTLVRLGADVGAKDQYGDQPVDRAEQAEEVRGPSLASSQREGNVQVRP